MMNSHQLDKDTNLSDKRKWIKYDTSRGKGNKQGSLIEEESHHRTDSARLFRVEFTSAGRNALGENPLLDTAETIRQTEYLEQLGEYDALHPLDSVRDFRNEDDCYHNESNHAGDHCSSFKNSILAKNTIAGMRKSILSKGYKPNASSSVISGKPTVSERAQAIRQRQKLVASKKNHNPFGYKFFGLQSQSGPNSFQQVYRSQDWDRVLLLNQQHGKQLKQSAGFKNAITNQAFQEVEVVEVVDCLGAGFSRNKKEEAFQKRNESSINMLRSFRTLDFEDKDEEYPLTDTVLGSLSLAQNLNRNSHFDNPTHGRQIEIPSEYTSMVQKDDVVHNMNNKQVQSARNKNNTSSVFKGM